ncbi:hypothetical protein [Bacillus mycoides]|uniref:hypothetical protein n=1 Tax=Bacillus mycoides TaxID=1405 RepID=UPI0009BF0A90|nr:hypothetical protein [Bacillus mycoides]
MLKIFRIISALIVISLALYGISTNPLGTMPYMFISLSVMSFIMSAEEKQKVNSTLSFFSGVFTLIVAIIIIFSR